MELSKPSTTTIPKWLELRRTMVNCSWYARDVNHQMEKPELYRVSKDNA